jgi:hypothetical protein
MGFKSVSLVVAGAPVVAAVTLVFTGSVLLLDPHGQIASAQLSDGAGRKQPLLNLGYLRVEVPDIEGGVQITCKNGSVILRGYVSPGVQTWLEMHGTSGCATREL